MQFDEFIPEDAEGISWHPYSLHTVYDNPQSRLAVIRARGYCMLFYYLVQSRLNDCELEKSELASVVIYDIFVWFPALAVLQ